MAFASFLTVMVAAAPVAGGLPVGIRGQLPAGHVVLAQAEAAPDAGHRFYLVAIGRARSKLRSLLIFRRDARGGYVAAGRNDAVVLGADDGGYNGCDPFEGGRIAVSGAYFTVENAVACGDHWTDYVTFRFNFRIDGYVFANWRVQSWRMNPREDPQAEALVADPPYVVRATRTIPFARWRRPR